MKKTAHFSAILCLCLLLSSCTINWFDEHITVPWFFIAIPVVIIIAIASAIVIRSFRKTMYYCSACENRFYPKRRYAFKATNQTDEVILKCPHCGKKTVCYPSHDQE